MDELHPGEAAAAACWRCSLPVEAGVFECPHCGATLWSQFATAPIEPVAVTRRPETVTTVLVFYGILLATSVVLGMIHHHRDGGLFSTNKVDPEAAWWQMAIFEGIDTAIVLWCCALVWSSLPAMGKPSRGKRIAAWALAAPVLAVVLGLNLGYHALLQSFVRSPFTYVDISATSPHLWVRWLLVNCAQPAIVEELFFRGLAFRALLPHLSPGGTVLVTSAAFGLMHIFSPLSIPMLTIIGVVLGCAALMTGRIWLSIVLHFCHNLAITLLEWYA